MTIVQAIISGLVQGLTEFLPVSSSGHLVILHHYFGFQEPQILFDICLHIATLGAVIFVFWREIIDIRRWKSGLGWALLIGSISTAIVGIWLGNIFDKRLFDNIPLVGAMLLITALWLLLGTIAAKIRKNKSTALNWWQALIIGISQGIALIPGISRSGATISTALILRREGKLAVYFSFLLSIPATFGALLYQLRVPFVANVISPSYFANLLAGGAVAFIVGLVALKIVLKVVGKNKLYFFSIYCFLLGVAVLILG